MNEQATAEITAPVAKAITMWATIAAGVGVSSWAEAASFATFCAAGLGALYSLLLVSEWFWKKVWRPVGEHFGLLKPVPRVWRPGDGAE